MADHSQGRTIIVSIRTVFEYGPAAVDSLINTYKKNSYSNYVECKFNPISHTFILEGDSNYAEAAFGDFMGLLQNKINEEAIQRRGPNEYAPIRRSRLTQLNSSAIVWSELEEDKDKDQDIKNKGVMSSNDLKYLQNDQNTLADTTSNYPCIEFWEPRITAADFSLMLHLHDGRSITNEIARVCHCALFPNWEKRNVKIGANSRATIEKAVKKLRKIEELFKRGFEPISMILVHPEEKKKFQLKLVSLEKQDELHRTTLFYNESKWSTYGADKMFLIRILEYSSLKDRFVPCHVEISAIWAAYNRTAAGPRDWADYIFDGWGSSDMNPLLALKRPGSADGLENEGLPDLSHLKPEDRVGQYNTPGGAPAPGEDSRDRQTQLPRTGVFQLGNRPRSVDEEPAPRRTTTSAVRVPMIRPGKERAATERPGVEGMEASTTPSSYIGDLTTLESAGADATDQVESGGLSKASSVITGVFSMPERHLGTGIERKVNVMGSFVEKTPATPTTRRTVRQPILREPKARPTVTNENSKPAEKEGVSEANTRDIQSTMKQRAPSHRRLHDGEDESNRLKQENISKFHDSITKSLEHVRSWQGHVKFEILLGRIILADVPRSISKHNIGWNEWHSSLSRSPEIKKIFTDLITTEFFDMEFVSDLKLSKAEMLFSPDHIKKRVTYEFHCNHKGKNRILEVDAANFETTIYGDQQEFGIVYWSHPLRSWDAKFALSGAKVLDNEIPVFKSLIESLYVPGDSAVPDISFLVRGRDFHITRVVVKRETRRPCLSRKITRGQDVDLVCKEVMEMVIKRHKSVPEQFRAMAKDRLHMVHEGLLHYSFALVPTKIEKALQQNLKLEIGEEVQWKTENLIGSPEEGTMLPGLEELVITVLRKTDDIGYNNNNSPDGMETA